MARFPASIFQTRLFFPLIAGVLIANASPASDAWAVFNVLDYGATGNGTNDDTSAIQQAVDACAANGGGQVVLPGGNKFLAGAIMLRSGVDFHLAHGGVLKGSPRWQDYGEAGALLFAKDADRVSITGDGTIDGQGRQLAQDVMRRLQGGEIRNQTGNTNRPDEEFRPMLVQLRHCRDVQVTGVTLKDSSCWVQNYDRCHNLVLDHIRVQSTAYWNNDGFDITDCSKVKITNCDINSADDGICLKSNPGGAGCADVDIANCRIRSSASALKFGTASYGGFRNIHAENLEVFDTLRSAVAIETVDGGLIDHVVIENVRATNTGNAVFIRLGRRNVHVPPGILRNVTIRNLHAEVPPGVPDADYEIAGPAVKAPHNLIPCSITGLPGYPVRGVTLENVEIVFAGGGTPQRAHVHLAELKTLPELSGSYPEFSMFGELPAWGFYLRHVAGVAFHNVRLTLKEPDFRPALVADDVHGLRIQSVNIEPSSGEPVIVLQDSGGARFQGVRYPAGIREKVRLLGNSSAPVESAEISGLSANSTALDSTVKRGK